MSIESLTCVVDQMRNQREPEIPERTGASLAKAASSSPWWSEEIAHARAEAIMRCSPQKPTDELNAPMKIPAIYEGVNFPIGE
eukprot:7591535-Heterocapsa_arctica.AAC.1